MRNLDTEIEKLTASIVQIKGERNSMIRETIETQLGCSLFDTAILNSAEYDKFDELKSTAEKMNIPIFILPSSKGNQYLYIRKCYVDAICEQMKQNRDTAAPEQKQYEPAKKLGSR